MGTELLATIVAAVDHVAVNGGASYVDLILPEGDRLRIPLTLTTAERVDDSEATHVTIKISVAQ